MVSQLNEEYNLSVFRASVVGMGVVEGAGVELALLARINTATPPLSWDLWNGFVSICNKENKTSLDRFFH